MASNRGSRTIAVRRVRIAMLGTFSIGASALAHAANNCAWINEATASGLLGGDAGRDVIRFRKAMSFTGRAVKIDGSIFFDCCR